MPNFIYKYHNLKKADQLAFEASLLILIKSVFENLPEEGIDYQQFANTIKNAMSSKVIKKTLNNFLSIIPRLDDNKMRTFDEDAANKEKIITNIATIINSFFNVFEAAIENDKTKEAFIDSKNKVLAEEKKNKHLRKFFNGMITNRKQNIYETMHNPATIAFQNMFYNCVYFNDRSYQKFNLSTEDIEFIDKRIEKYIASQNPLNND